MYRQRYVTLYFSTIAFKVEIRNGWSKSSLFVFFLLWIQLGVHSFGKKVRRKQKCSVRIFVLGCVIFYFRSDSLCSGEGRRVEMNKLVERHCDLLTRINGFYEPFTSANSWQEKVENKWLTDKRGDKCFGQKKNTWCTRVQLHPVLLSLDEIKWKPLSESDKSFIAHARTYDTRHLNGAGESSTLLPLIFIWERQGSHSCRL